jgi:Aspartyl/Asparaginyl beta-hydroxylase
MSQVSPTFIEKTQLVCQHDKIQDDLTTVLNQYAPWTEFNQISLRHRPDYTDDWYDGVGSTYDSTQKKYRFAEKDFSQVNRLLPNFCQAALEQLSIYLDKPLGRARFMRLLPKTGLSIHKDNEERYHLAIKTNSNAIIAEVFDDSAVRCTGYHIPANNFWYRVNTEKLHFVYNGSFEERIHLVVCPA